MAMSIIRCSGRRVAWIFCWSAAKAMPPAPVLLSSPHSTKDFGLQGSKQKQQSYWLPDLSLTRNTFRELSDSSPELRRAIALTAELLFIQKNWYLAGTNEIFHFPPQKLFDALLSDRNKELKQEILQSRGYWTYQDTDQPYMSLIKVLQLLMPTEK